MSFLFKENVKDMIDIIFIDKKLRTMIKEFSSLGYKPISSCAGHKTKGEMGEGFITFEGKHTKDELENLLRGKGLDITKIEIETTVRFKGLGGPRNYQKDSLAFIPHPDIPIERKLALFYRNLDKVGIHHLSKTAALIRYTLSCALSGRDVKK